MSGRRLSEDERRLIRLAFLAHANHDAIAMLVGRSLRTVGDYLRSLGLFRHRSRYHPHDPAQSRTDSPMAQLARDCGRRRLPHPMRWAA